MRIAKNRKNAAMGIFKPDFYRFFTIGFAAGALFVVGSMEGSVAHDLTGGLIPAAEAHADR